MQNMNNIKNKQDFMRGSTNHESYWNEQREGGNPPPIREKLSHPWGRGDFKISLCMCVGMFGAEGREREERRDGGGETLKTLVGKAQTLFKTLLVCKVNLRSSLINKPKLAKDKKCVCVGGIRMLMCGQYRDGKGFEQSSGMTVISKEYSD